jgi:myosin heavy chain 6/7
LIYIFSITEAEKVAFLLGVNAGDLLKSLLKPKIKVGTEVVTQGRTKAQVRYISIHDLI